MQNPGPQMPVTVMDTNREYASEFFPIQLHGDAILPAGLYRPQCESRPQRFLLPLQIEGRPLKTTRPDIFSRAGAAGRRLRR